MIIDKAAREALAVSRNIRTAKALRDAIRIVKDVVNTSLTPNGLTTAEIYQLACSKKPSTFFQPADVPQGTDPLPPNMQHPVRSMAYLKKKVLPILEGHRMIQMKYVTRSPSPPDSSPPSTTDVPPGTSTIQTKVWAWVPLQNETGGKHLQEKEIQGKPVNPTDRWDHLNTRRKRSRVDKMIREYQTLQKSLGERGQKVLPLQGQSLYDVYGDEEVIRGRSGTSRR
ncbi:hypothetical protein APHAL10511_002880 [Amanita phalloides]|nr:hypothetical protein APHAL10511_002880 [Amanita phalloides]